MTKKELELENKFLKLQLKIIANKLQANYKDTYEQNKNIGYAIYHARDYQKNLDFILEEDLPYNFFDEDIEI